MALFRYIVMSNLGLHKSLKSECVVMC